MTTTESLTHTPGPWTAVRSSHQREWSYWILGSGPSDVAAVSTQLDDATADANAALIVAAPELLATCERFVFDECQPCTCALGAERNGGVLPCAVCQARAAIAKVRGCAA